MYKNSTDKKIPQFPCDFCKEICPLNGDDCPAKKDLKEFFKSIDPEKVYDAYEEYLKLIGLEVIEI